MTGKDYADLIASYVIFNYSDRGIEVYREIPVGTSIIGKNRRLDIFVLQIESQRAFAIECKYQEMQGTVDEKIPYALQDMAALAMPGCIVYAGEGFSQGVLHLLQSSEIAAFCFPDRKNLVPSATTRELDHKLALSFQWWDILIGDRKPFSI